MTFNEAIKKVLHDNGYFIHSIDSWNPQFQSAYAHLAAMHGVHAVQQQLQPSKLAELPLSLAAQVGKYMQSIAPTIDNKVKELAPIPKAVENKIAPTIAPIVGNIEETEAAVLKRAESFFK